MARRRPPVVLTTHAVDRFAQRAGARGSRADVQRDLQRLIARDGHEVTRRPRWGRSRTRSDALLQIGDWLLLPLVRDERDARQLVAVTVICRDGETSWRDAYRHGWTRVGAPSRVRRALRVLRRRLGR